jgi:hypothetical protein
VESCSILLFSFTLADLERDRGEIEEKRRQTLSYITPPRCNNHPLRNIYSLSLYTLVLSRDYRGGLAPPSFNLSIL